MSHLARSAAWAASCFFARAGVFHDPGEGEFGVFGSLRQAAGEIVETAGEPGIVLAQAVHAQRDEFVGEKFGERRSNGFEVRARGDEVARRLHGVSRGGQECLRREWLARARGRWLRRARSHFSMPPGLAPSPS